METQYNNDLDAGRKAEQEVANYLRDNCKSIFTDVQWIYSETTSIAYDIVATTHNDVQVYIEVKDAPMAHTYTRYCKYGQFFIETMNSSGHPSGIYTTYKQYPNAILIYKNLNRLHIVKLKELIRHLQYHPDSYKPFQRPNGNSGGINIEISKFRNLQSYKFIDMNNSEDDYWNS